MRILLIGEYSHLHNTLKKGLVTLGHEVTIVANGDGFKNYPVDIKIDYHYNSGWKKKWKMFIFNCFGIDLHSKNIKKQIIKHQKNLQHYDVVQFINESPFLSTPKKEQEIFDLILNWNKKVFLLSCGTDYISIQYAFNQKLKYSLLTPYFEKKGSLKNYHAPLKYLGDDFKILHEHIFKNVSGLLFSRVLR